MTALPNHLYHGMNKVPDLHVGHVITTWKEIGILNLKQMFILSEGFQVHSLDRISK